MDVVVRYSATLPPTGRAVLSLHELQDLYLARHDTVVPLCGPTAPLHATGDAASTQQSPISTLSPAALAALSASANSASGVSLPNTDGSDLVLRTVVAEWFCPSCLTTPKRVTDGHCMFCFQCPACPGTTLRYHRTETSRTYTLQCPVCMWSSQDTADTMVTLNNAWFKRDPVELQVHTGVVRRSIMETIAPFSTTVEGTAAAKEQRNLEAAQQGLHPCVARDKLLAARYDDLAKRLKLGSDARGQHLRFIQQGSGNKSVAEYCAEPYQTPMEAIPMTVDLLSGVNARNHPSAVQLARQDTARVAVVSRGGLVATRVGASETADTAAAAQFKLRSSAPLVTLQRVPLLARSTVQSVRAADATNFRAPAVTVSELAPLATVLAKPDAEGRDYTYNSLALNKTANENSLNAARLLPTVAACPVYHAAPTAPQQSAPSPTKGEPSRPHSTAAFVHRLPRSSVKTADGLPPRERYEVAFYLTGVVRIQPTYIRRIEVCHAACDGCFVESSLPAFGANLKADPAAAAAAATVEPPAEASDGARLMPVITLMKRAEVNTTALLRYGVRRAAFAADHGFATGDAASKPIDLAAPLDGSGTNIAVGFPLAPRDERLLTTDAALTKPCIINLANRIAFLTVLTDTRVSAATRPMIVAFKLDVTVAGVDVSYLVHAAVHTPQ
jgi:hypothetical protein